MRLLIAIVLLICISAPAYAEDTWTGIDKKMHFAGGTFLGVVGFAYTDITRPLAPRSEKFWEGFTLAASAGLIKELYDGSKDDNHFCYKDLVVTIIGGTIGAGLGVTLDYIEHGDTPQQAEKYEVIIISKAWKF